MVVFQEVLEQNDLKNLNSMGPFFTWFNGRRDGQPNWERLDRVVGNIFFKQCHKVPRYEVCVTSH